MTTSLGLFLRRRSHWPVFHAALLLGAGFVGVECLAVLRAQGEPSPPARETARLAQRQGSPEESSAKNNKEGSPDLGRLSAKARRIFAQRRQRDETVWKPEVDAQAYERVFLAMWDELRATGHSFDCLDGVPLASIHVPEPASVRALEWGISETSYQSGKSPLSKGEFRQWLDRLQSAGYQLHESEWHHSEFRPAAADRLLGVR